LVLAELVFEVRNEDFFFYFYSILFACLCAL
jgi:hypothetical protein